MYGGDSNRGWAPFLAAIVLTLFCTPEPSQQVFSSSKIHSMGVRGRGFEVLTAAWLSEGKGAWLSFLIIIACQAGP